jgi:hypothetical protein
MNFLDLSAELCNMIYGLALPYYLPEKYWAHEIDWHASTNYMDHFDSDLLLSS